MVEIIIKGPEGGLANRPVSTAWEGKGNEIGDNA